MDPALAQMQAEIHALRQEVEVLRRDAALSNQKQLAYMLRRRGVTVIKHTPHQRLILPLDYSPATADELYRLMKKYSFRIFLRDVLLHVPHLEFAHLTKYCSEQVARQYLTHLTQAGMLVRGAADQYHLPPGIEPSFGAILEWFVAEIMQREFGVPACWGNRLKDSASGGDYDVIACVEGRLLYLEVKSSPPKHITAAEVRGFFDRIQTLRPDGAIFLEDTHLRMQDKLVVLFEAELAQCYGTQAPNYPLRRVHNEMFAIHNTIFLTNTKPDLIANLTVCLKHFLARGL